MPPNPIPKDAETLMKEFEEQTMEYCMSGCGCERDQEGIAHEGSCKWVFKTQDELNDWLESSLASYTAHLLSVMPSSERYPYPFNPSEKETDEAIYKAIDDCRSAIQREAGIEQVCD